MDYYYNIILKIIFDFQTFQSSFFARKEAAGLCGKKEAGTSVKVLRRTLSGSAECSLNLVAYKTAQIVPETKGSLKHHTK